MNFTHKEYNELLGNITSLQSQLNDLNSALTPTSTINGGDTAWMLCSCALVLFMTMPGLAIYYSGMVRTKNVLATIMQSFTICCLITFLWLCFGYSISFGPVNYPIDNHYLVYGSGDRLWLNGLSLYSTHELAPTIPESVFCVFQLTFAIITAALISGSFADRMRFLPMIVFITLWHAVVYCPIAHSVWHPNGFLNQAGALDFAGGNVVHICSGTSGLMSAIVLGHRKGFGKERFDPHNILITFIGLSMLWVGWFGFNAGSAYGANAIAGNALLITQISTAIASLSWMITEWIVTGKPSLLGMISGAVAGLVTITPMAGYVDQTAAFIAGLVGGPICYFGAQVKHSLGYDDALDAFGVHAIGGITGGILVGFFANPEIAPQSPTPHIGVFYGNMHDGGHQLAMQLYAIVVTIGWSAFASYLLLILCNQFIQLRVSEEEEEAGLDESLHGESLHDAKKDILTLSAHGTNDIELSERNL